MPDASTARRDPLQRIRDLGPIAEGAIAGAFAGVPFAIAELINPGFMGDRAMDPVRVAASMAMGSHALTAVSRGEIRLVSLLVHLALSAIYGAIYGAANDPLSLRTRARPDLQVILGAVFGLTVWFFNFRIVAPISYPWLIVTAHLKQAALHAVFFGVPLGIVFSAFERRVLDETDEPGAVNIA